MKTIITILLGLLALLQTSPAFAHKLRVFAWEEGGRIVAEAKFNGGRPARKAKVTVTHDGKEVLVGKTDTTGIFRFPLPEKISGNLDIVISTGDGHRGSWLYSMGTSDTTPDNTAQPPSPSPVLTSTPQQTVAGIDYGKLQTIIDSSLDKQLAPIRKELAEATNPDPSLQDILGGLGYILGLAGIAAYMQSRKKRGD